MRHGNQRDDGKAHENLLSCVWGCTQLHKIHHLRRRHLPFDHIGFLRSDVGEISLGRSKGKKCFSLWKLVLKAYLSFVLQQYAGADVCSLFGFVD